MKAMLYFLALTFVYSNSAFAMACGGEESPPQVQKMNRVEITKATCAHDGNSQISVIENSGIVSYKIGDNACADLQSKYANALSCTSVRADLEVEDHTSLGGLMGSKTVTSLSNEEARGGMCR